MKQLFTLSFAILLLFCHRIFADPLDTWTIRQTDTIQNLTGIGYGLGLYVATGQQGLILTSPDGINWTPRSSGTTQWIADVACGNNIFVTAGQSGLILSSPDGFNWTPRSSGSTANYNRIRFLNGQFITIGDQSTISTSPDGVNWSTQHTGPNPHYNVNYANGLYVIVGLGQILTSTDAINWTPESTSVNSGDVVYGKGVFVISGGSGLIMTSPDGFSWTSQNSLPTPGTGLAALDYAKGTFVGVGGFGDIFSSTDGKNWTPRKSGVSVNLWNCKYLNGAFWAVGEQGTIVSDSVNLNNGLVAYYPFSGSANDLSGNSINGIVYNATLTTDRFGNANSAYYFNGFSSYIDIPQTSQINLLTSTFTLSAWIYQFSAIPSGYEIMNKCTYGRPDGWAFDTYGLGYSTGHRLRLQAAYPNATNVAGATDYSLLQWHHVVATVSGTVGKVYLDGMLDGTGNVGSIPSNALDVYFGHTHPSNGGGNLEWFNGIIDDVRIYNRALSDSEVQSLYAFESSNPKSVISGNIQISSTLTVTSTSVPANGQSNVTATVTLLNGVNNPVPGRTVKFMSSRSTTDDIPQPKSVTDANGQASATISSTIPGKSTISVSDLTDGLVVQQQPTVQFTSGSVLPGNDLSNAIVQLANDTGNILTGVIPNLAAQIGTNGDIFNNLAISEKNSRAQTIGFGIIGAALPFAHLDDVLFPELANPTTSKGLLEKTLANSGISLFTDFTSFGVGKVMDDIAGLTNGLSLQAQDIANCNNTYQNKLLNFEQPLMSGVPPICSNKSSAFVYDMYVRRQANDTLTSLLNSQSVLFQKLKDNADVENIPLLAGEFMVINVVVSGAGALIGSPKIIDEGFNAVESAITWSQNESQLKENQAAYMQASCSIYNCSYFSSLISANTSSAFDEIKQGRQPNPVRGTILSADSFITYHPVLFPESWYKAINVTTLAWILKDYTVVTITNTSGFPAYFNVNSTYFHTFDVVDQLGLHFHGTLTIPQVVSSIAYLNANESKQVTLTYFNYPNGVDVDIGSTATISVLGFDTMNGIYAVDATTSAFVPKSDTGVTGNVAVKYFGLTGNGPIPLDSNSSSTNFLETPIYNHIYQDVSNQVYQSRIWVSNPFSIPLVASVTQALPAGVAVLSTDGELGISNIVWTNTVPTNGQIMLSFTFTIGVTPGVTTNLPAPTLVYSDDTGTNSITFNSAPAFFNGLNPLQVIGFIPSVATNGVAIIPVAITNFGGTGENGNITLTLKDSAGNVVTNITQSFYVDGLNGTNIYYPLFGNPSPGTYSVSGVLNNDGGLQQVFAGVYVVPLAPVILGFSSTPPLTNGINMMLQGPIGSNYLVEVSSDLVNWTPIVNFYATSSPFYFSDPGATNYNQRFYRAVLFDAAPIASTNTPLLVFCSTQPLTTSGFQLKVAAPISSTCVIQASTNLVSWQMLSQFVVQSATVYFTDPQATNFSKRFYRALTQ